MAVTPLMTAFAAGIIASAGHGDMVRPHHSFHMMEPRHTLHIASADCGAAARRVVARTGGQLLSVDAVRRGGRVVCRVTVLVPGSGDQRPRKVTVAVPE